MKDVSIFRGIVDMNDMGFCKFMFHREEELKCKLTVKRMIISEHGLLEPTGHCIDVIGIFILVRMRIGIDCYVKIK